MKEEQEKLRSECLIANWGDSRSWNLHKIWMLTCKSEISFFQYVLGLINIFQHVRSIFHKNVRHVPPSILKITIFLLEISLVLLYLGSIFGRFWENWSQSKETMLLSFHMWLNRVKVILNLCENQPEEKWPKEVLPRKNHRKNLEKRTPEVLRSHWQTKALRKKSLLTAND